MILEMLRHSYTPTETQGFLMPDKFTTFHTIERPWIKGPMPGGMSFESCVPDGHYELVPHTRPDGAETVALVNPDLGVWYRKEDRPDVWGRFLVLIHAGNYSSDVVGCIAPGLGRTIHNNQVMVTSSRAAMRQLDVRRFTQLNIRTTDGAHD